MLLPRVELPLSCLDTSSSSASATALPQSRLFEGHIKILELEERMGNQPMVLIARLDDGRTLYAIERESKGLHALCRIGSWVDLNRLKAQSLGSNSPAFKSVEPVSSTRVTERDATPILTPTTASYSKEKSRAIQAIQSMVKRRSPVSASESQSAPPEKPQVENKEDCKPAPDELMPQELDAAISAQPTADEIFDNVRSQYFEALYLSKVRLSCLSCISLF